MTTAKTNPTRKAVRRLLSAHAERERGCLSTSPYLAAEDEREAERLLTLGAPPELGIGGEVIPAPGGTTGRGIIRETLTRDATAVAADASAARAELLLDQPGAGVLPLALDAAEAIGAANSLEKMLAHQMALAHDAALRLMSGAMARAERGDSIESARLANTAARLISVYQDGLMTLQRLRAGGVQRVLVQHIDVRAGGQALVGNVTTGGRRRGKGAR